MGSTFYIRIKRPDMPWQRWQYGSGYVRGGLYVAPKYSRRKIDTVRRQILHEIMRGGFSQLEMEMAKVWVPTLEANQPFSWVLGLTACIEEVPDKPNT